MSLPVLRKLTESEIQEILNLIPLIHSSSKRNAEVSTASLRETFRQQLIHMPPIDPRAINDLKEIILRRYENARIAPGTPAGIRAAVAMAAIAMQTTLNSFHTSGTQKTVASTSDRMGELVDAKTKLKAPSCQIHFTGPPLTLDDILLKKRGDLKSISVAEVIKNLNEFIVDRSYNFYSEKDDGWWYDLFFGTFSYNRPVITATSSPWAARLFINVNTLYAYDILMSDVAAVLESKGTVMAVYSPISEGIIDIYPREQILLEEASMNVTAATETEEEEEEETEEAEETEETEPIEEQRISQRTNESISIDRAGMHFLRNVFMPSLDSLMIKGVKGITGVYPKTVPVWSLVREEVNVDPENRVWDLYYNKLTLRFSGIQVEHLINLCQLAGIRVLNGPIEEDYLKVQMPVPDPARGIGSGSPGKYIEFLIEEYNKQVKIEEGIQREAGIEFPRVPSSPFIRATTYVYAETDGSNLKELFARPDVDSRYTISNDGNEVLTTLGIEATRNFLIREYLLVVSADGAASLDPRHLTVIVDIQVSRGRFMPFTNYTISRMEIDALAKSSFQKPMKVLTVAAAVGEKAAPTSVASSVFTGRRIRMGSGYVNVNVDPEYIEKYRKAAQAKPVNAGDIRQALDNINRPLNEPAETNDLLNPGSLVQPLFSRARGTLSAPALAPPTRIGTIPVTVPTKAPPASTLVTPVLPRPVISNLAASVPTVIKAAPCLNVGNTTVSVQALAPIPTGRPVSKAPEKPIASVITLPTSTNASGLPPGVGEMVTTAENVQLPEFNTAAKNTLSQLSREQSVERASLEKFLQTRGK